MHRRRGVSSFAQDLREDSEEPWSSGCLEVFVGVPVVLREAVVVGIAERAVLCGAGGNGRGRLRALRCQGIPRDTPARVRAPRAAAHLRQHLCRLHPTRRRPSSPHAHRGARRCHQAPWRTACLHPPHSCRPPGARGANTTRPKRQSGHVVQGAPQRPYSHADARASSRACVAARAP